MIALKRRRSARDVPASFRRPKLLGAAKKLIKLYYDARTSGTFAFASSAWKPAKSALKKDSFDKCAYCEAPTAIVAHGDVEHFRPKSVYWWLAFCFDNYLYSCQICNQTHKGDRFPTLAAILPAPEMPAVKPAGAALDALATSLVVDAVVATDAQLLAAWSAEEADLINPYLEDPEPLLAYEPDDANQEMWLRSAGGVRADRAVRAAHDVLGANRQELLRARYAMYLTFAAFKVILQAQVPDAVRAIALQEFRRMQAVSEPFAGMRRYFARTWGLPGPV